MKRALSFILSLVMGFSVLTVSASAAQKPGNSPAQETRSIKGRQASSAMVEMLEEEGIPVTEDTVIELVPLSSTETGIATLSADDRSGGSALVITNKEGTEVTTDILAFVAADGSGFSDMYAILASPDYKSHDFKIYNKISIHGTAVYKQYSHDGLVYTSPQGVKFTYTKYQECNVPYIEMIYTCNGGNYSYPGLVHDGTNAYYTVNVEQTNPKTSITYSKMKTYPSNKVIFAQTGGDYASPGNSLTFTVTLDGKTYTDSAGVDAPL